MHRRTCIPTIRVHPHLPVEGLGLVKPLPFCAPRLLLSCAALSHARASSLGVARAALGRAEEETAFPYGPSQSCHVPGEQNCADLLQLPPRAFLQPRESRGGEKRSRQDHCSQLDYTSWPPSLLSSSPRHSQQHLLWPSRLGTTEPLQTGRQRSSTL